MGTEFVFSESLLEDLKTKTLRITGNTVHTDGYSRDYLLVKVSYILFLTHTNL